MASRSRSSSRTTPSAAKTPSTAFHYTVKDATTVARWATSRVSATPLATTVTILIIKRARMATGDDRGADRALRTRTGTRRAKGDIAVTAASVAVVVPQNPKKVAPLRRRSKESFKGQR